MSCLHEGWEGKDSVCWKASDDLCNVMESVHTAGSRLSCFLSQLQCHWLEDYASCESEHGSGTFSDRRRNDFAVLSCTDNFLFSLYGPWE